MAVSLDLRPLCRAPSNFAQFHTPDCFIGCFRLGDSPSDTLFRTLTVAFWPDALRLFVASCFPHREESVYAFLLTGAETKGIRPRRRLLRRMQVRMEIRFSAPQQDNLQYAILFFGQHRASDFCKLGASTGKSHLYGAIAA